MIGIYLLAVAALKTNSACDIVFFSRFVAAVIRAVCHWD